MRLINFQCFKDSGDIPINPMTIFIGENDSGKTCLFRALDCFFRDKPPGLDIFHQLNGNREINCSIIMIFKVNADERMSREFVVGGKVAVKKEFQIEQNETVQQAVLINRFLYNDEKLNSINELKAPQLKEECKLYNLEYTTAEESKERLFNFVQKNFDSLDKTAKFCSIRWSEISPIMPIFEHYDSSYYTDPRRLIEATLRNVYRTHFNDYDKEGNENLKPEFAVKREAIKKELDKKIQESLKEKVVSKIGKVKNIYGDYSIDFSSGFALSDILVDFGPGSNSINIIGEGSKKRLIMAIMEWDKEIKKQEPHRMVIRGYDEPDSNLHYGAQKEMYYTLRDLASESPLQTQILICTHSISMIDRAPAKYINHIVQKDGISHIEYLMGYEESDIKEFLERISEISGIRNSSLFFERCFVIVEGETEYNALPAIYRKLTGRSLFEDGIVLINLKGNGSWEPFLKLLNKNKQNATVLFLDRDTQQYSDRKITIDKLKQIGFSQEFLNQNVILVGTNEFEDIFSDELIGRDSAIGCYLYILFIYATRGVAKWEKEVQSLDS